MTDATKKKGGRLGPFQLGRRCKHAAAELGHIHEARNVQTGAPAMVMLPGPRPTWRPRKTWQVRASFQATPPFIALEVERAPASGRLAELADLLTLLLAGLEAIEINGGCWVALKQRPPCHEEQAEYKGDCYLPVSSNRGSRLPQSVSP
jgi:hypothetical protein